MQTYFFLNLHPNKLDLVLALATRICLYPDPRYPVPDGFGALLFIHPAPKVLAEIKELFYTALPFDPSLSD